MYTVVNRVISRGDQAISMSLEVDPVSALFRDHQPFFLSSISVFAGLGYHLGKLIVRSIAYAKLSDQQEPGSADRYTYNSNKTIRIQKAASDLAAASGLVEKHCATRYEATTSKRSAMTRLKAVFLASRPKDMCVETMAMTSTPTTTGPQLKLR